MMRCFNKGFVGSPRSLFKPYQEVNLQMAPRGVGHTQRTRPFSKIGACSVGNPSVFMDTYRVAV